MYSVAKDKTMSVKVLGKPVRWNTQLYAKDLDEAYRLGYFNNSMTRWELEDRIVKYNPQLRTYASKTHRGIFDTDRGMFIMGISHNMTIPKFTMFRYDRSKDRKLDSTTEHGEYLSSEVINMDDDEGKMLVRGWKPTLETLESYGYKIDKRGL